MKAGLILFAKEFIAGIWIALILYFLTSIVMLAIDHYNHFFSFNILSGKKKYIKTA